MSEASYHHLPVMVHDVVDLFGSVPPGTVVDATVGGGGHAEALLEAWSHLTVVGIDRDLDAVAAAAERLSVFGARAQVHHARFDDLANVMSELGHQGASGVLFDLGVSSPQLDRAERGFSHRREGPLDMRMNTSTTSGSRTAAELVNHESEAELARLVRELGDERYAARIARAIVAARPLATTTELAEVVRDAIPAPARRRGRHPATRTFQALRIAVNDELAILPGALDQAIELLVPGGRCVALAYHSGEDRIVKSRFRLAATGGCTCPAHLPCGCGAIPTVRLVHAGSRTPSPEETAANPRAASARLRAVERLAPGHLGTAREHGALHESEADARGDR
ncbi:MAG: 16S rRNA (cytosine(1402)-N(4))-methyltransferase RsmH [Actinobacteria bacterium]|nr:16S rRNA (cytosine(1402)-N(4))-methyltransferase RsmH [Actinomycetota bacterium]